MTPVPATDMPDPLGDIEEGLRLEKFGMLDRALAHYEAAASGDDPLTVEEFAKVLPPAVQSRVIMKKDTGKHANDHDLLTRDEWNPGGASGAH